MITNAATPPEPAARRRRALVAGSATDRERLRTGFAMLRRRGVLARQTFTCCSTCALAALQEVLTDPGRALSYQGYVVYNRQGHEAAARGRGLHLQYGSISGAEADIRAVGTLVVRALADVGLQPEWDGDPKRTIYLPLNWTG